MGPPNIYDKFTPMYFSNEVKHWFNFSAITISSSSNFARKQMTNLTKHSVTKTFHYFEFLPRIFQITKFTRWLVDGFVIGIINFLLTGNIDWSVAVTTLHGGGGDRMDNVCKCIGFRLKHGSRWWTTWQWRASLKAEFCNVQNKWTQVVFV